MPTYAEMDNVQLAALKEELEREYGEIKARGLALNMARGKPAKAQLDLSMPLLETVTTMEDCVAADGTDCRNYGVGFGLPEAKEFMACMLDDEPDNVIVFGNASLNIMYDTVARCWMFGTLGSEPWGKLDTVKWICPAPGYDRHFGVTEEFGIEMIPVPMTDEGPDMDEVERIAASDASVKGIWCVPKYSNPGGTTYSDETVRRLAAMECAANDFRIFWDNAYCVHHLFDDAAEQDQLLLEYIKEFMTVLTIGYDKVNQLRHVRFLRDAEGLAAHMAKHAAILRPKFELVNAKLQEGLDEVGGCSWSNPRGGYFVSFDAPQGCAKRVVTLAKEAGVTMTGAGATYPYKQDPNDSNIRIAPPLPPLEELDEAMDVFTVCVKLAYVEKLLG